MASAGGMVGGILSLRCRRGGMEVACVLNSNCGLLASQQQRLFMIAVGGPGKHSEGWWPTYPMAYICLPLASGGFFPKVAGAPSRLLLAGRVFFRSLGRKHHALAW